MIFSPTLYHGESRVIPLTVVDPNAPPNTSQFADLSTGKWQIATAEWQVKAAIEAPDPPLLSHSLVDGGITITPGTVAEQLKVFVAPGDTPSITPGGYFHDLVVVFTSGFRLYLIKPCGIQILGVVNQL
jgi:hypothetical protein